MGKEGRGINFYGGLALLSICMGHEGRDITTYGIYC